VHAAAARGVRGAGRLLPYADRVQQALGRHRLDAVRAYTDAPAFAACRDLGADAYTVGDKIAFASRNPDLRTVAHEAAHVIQQRAGIQPGNDRANHLERRAEAAADAIEHGRSPAGFLPESGSQRSAVGVPAVQASVSVRAEQSLLGSLFWAQPPRALESADELTRFVSQHRVSIDRIVRAKRYEFWHSMLPALLSLAASGMIGDREERVYDDTVDGARELANELVENAYGRFGSRRGEMPTRVPVSTPSPSFVPRTSFEETGTSTTKFEYLSGLAEKAPVPQSLADYGSRRARTKIEQHTPQQPVREGVEEAFKGRKEALTSLPKDPRKAVELLPWLDYYINGGGDKDMQRTVDIAASKMSAEEARKFKDDFEKLKFDQAMKVAASAGTSIAVGQGIGLIPHPAAKVVKVAWQATGAVAASNKLAEVSDKLEKFKEEHQKGFQIMEEQRNKKLEVLQEKRRETISEGVREFVLH
jgi:Domain of unknown function (DUF4157)